MRYMQNRLYKIFAISWIIRLAVFAVGPYEYKLYSIQGVLYMAFVDFLFWLGLQSGKWIQIPKVKIHFWDNVIGNNPQNRFISNEFVLLLIILSTAFFTLWFFDWKQSIGLNYLFSNEDIRRLISQRRTVYSKIGEFGSSIGILPFLIVQTGKDSGIYNKFNRTFCNVTAVFSGIISFASGARWGIVSIITIFFFVEQSKGKSLKLKHGSVQNGKTWIRRITICIVTYIILRRIWLLFQNRGVYHGAQRFLFEHGDTVLKPFWRSFLEKNFLVVDTICAITGYFAQPIPVFSYVFQNYSNQKCYFGASMFRVIGFLLNGLGINVLGMKDIYSHAFTGLYTSYVYGFIVDWGVYCTPFFVLFTGIIFSLIEQNHIKQGLHRLLYPLMEVMVLFAPYYYFFHIGAMDFYLFWLFLFSVLPVSRASITSDKLS